MGTRGPKKTPTAILKVRGSWLVNDRKDEPELTCEPVPCPAWVSPAGQMHWEEISQILDGMGLLARPFSVSMGLFVNCLGEYIALVEECRTIPRTYQTEKGVVASPEHKQLWDVWQKLLSICREFGLTPSSIASVKSMKAEKSEKKGIGAFKIG